MMNFYSLQNHHQTSTPLKYTTRKTHIEVSLDSYGLQLFAGASYMEDGGGGGEGDRPIFICITLNE